MYVFSQHVRLPGAHLHLCLINIQPSKESGIRIVITMSPMVLPVISPHEDSCNVTLNAFEVYGNLCKNNQLLAIYSGREYCGETFIIVFKYIMGSFAEYGNQWFFIIPKFQLREMR